MMIFKSALKRLTFSRLLKDSFWSLGGAAIGKGLSLIAGIIVARYLGKDVYGEYGLIKSTIFTVALFSTFGFGVTTTKFAAEFHETNNLDLKKLIFHSQWITLAFSGTVGIILYLYASEIASNWLGKGQLADSLRIFSILVVLNAIITTQTGILSGIGRFKEVAKISALTGLVFFCSSILLAYYYSLSGALFGLLCAQVVNALLNQAAIIVSLPRGSCVNHSPRLQLRTLIAFSTPIALQEAIYSGFSWISAILLVNTTDYGQLGIYTASMQWNAFCLMIPGVLKPVVLSHLSRAQRGAASQRGLLQQAATINLIATMLPALGIVILRDMIISLYGEQFVAMGDPLIMAVISAIAMSASNVYLQAYISIGRNWLVFWLRSARDGLIVVGFLLLVQFAGTPGATSITASTLAFHMLFLLIIFVAFHRIESPAKISPKQLPE